MDFLLSTLFCVDDTGPLTNNNHDHDPTTCGFFSSSDTASPSLRRSSLRRNSLSIDSYGVNQNQRPGQGCLRRSSLRRRSVATDRPNYAYEAAAPAEPDGVGGRRRAAVATDSEDQWRWSSDTYTDSDPVVFANPRTDSGDSGDAQVTWRCQLCGEHGDQDDLHQAVLCSTGYHCDKYEPAKHEPEPPRVTSCCAPGKRPARRRSRGSRRGQSAPPECLMASLMSAAVMAEREEEKDERGGMRALYQAVLEDAKAEASSSPTTVDGFERVLEERARAFSRDDKQQAGEVDEVDVQVKGPVLHPAKSKSAHTLQLYLTPPETGEGEGVGTGAGAGAGAGTDPPRGNAGARPSAGITGALVASTAVREEPRGRSGCAKRKALRRGSL
mmetsp:Transcript_69734/g.194932  ORF Transcript_69734/g.194932 Transcript_69734/m.194932 type:complete len:385 (+) Transcript_69734:108-1262(+)